MKTFTEYAEFKKFDRELRAEGEKLSNEFLSHVISGVNFFHTTGNHNIQIVNDILDTSSAMRLQRNRIVDWVAGIVGHEVVKVAGGRFGFGKKLEETNYDEITEQAGDYLSLYPDWYAFKPEAAPEVFEVEKASLQIKKYLEKMAKKSGAAGYGNMAALLAEFKEKFAISPVLQPDLQDIEGEVNEVPEQALIEQAA